MQSIMVHTAIIPCSSCQKKDTVIRGGYQVSHINKLHRIQGQRDSHGKDLLQPYDGRTPNKDFFTAYPDKIDSYGVRDQLSKL